MLYLTLRQYEYVTAIARQGSLSAAADDVNVSQPALSAALSRIESRLGKTLFFRRKGAALVLTPEGRDFVRQAEDLLARAARLERTEPDAPAPQSLVLGCFVDLAPFLLAPALNLMRRNFPGIAVSYRVEGFQALTTAMIDGQVDLAVTYDLGLDAGFDRHTLAHAVPCAHVAADHPLATRSEIDLATLADHPLILFQEGMSAQHVLALFRERDLRPRVVHRAASLEILRSLAAHGEGIGLSYSRPPGHLSYDGRPVVAIPVSDPAAVEPIILARHGTAPLPPQRAGVLSALAGGLGAAWG